VTGKAPNYIWRKWVAPDWLQRHERKLAERTDGKHAVIERPGRARLGIEFFSDGLRGVRALAETFGGSVIRLPVDWEARYFESHKTKPLRIGRRLVIRGDPDPGETIPVLVIPAGAAFGTGEHATTAMSLRLLERATHKLSPGWRMLDAGTGSGILALAGRRFGASSVIAVDNDPQAVRTARENARRNGLRGVKFIHGDINRHVAGAFDIVTANLYSELLAAVLPRFRKCLRGGGRLILSGVLRGQEPTLRRALRANSFRVLEARRRGKWVALLAESRPKT
jgi:ribosomal protein L11 methyltransferase